MRSKNFEEQEKNVEIRRVFGITIQAVMNAVRDIEKKRHERELSKEIAVKELAKYSHQYPNEDQLCEKI